MPSKDILSRKFLCFLTQHGEGEDYVVMGADPVLWTLHIFSHRKSRHLKEGSEKRILDLIMYFVQKKSVR